MRIIAGRKRGMKLFSPKTTVTRPIIDRVKESLFSVLFKYDLPADKVVGDLFSGVGSLGLEALSRGAQFVTFVENDSNVLTTLNKNIEKAGFIKDSKVIKANAFKIGAPPCPGGRIYDLIFVDPPYADTENVGIDSRLGNLLDILAGQIEPGGFVVVRTRRTIELPDQYGSLKVIERRGWGTMAITILQQESNG